MSISAPVPNGCECAYPASRTRRPRDPLHMRQDRPSPRSAPAAAVEGGYPHSGAPSAARRDGTRGRLTSRRGASARMRGTAYSHHALVGGPAPLTAHAEAHHDGGHDHDNSSGSEATDSPLPPPPRFGSSPVRGGGGRQERRRSRSTSASPAGSSASVHTRTPSRRPAPAGDEGRRMVLPARLGADTADMTGRGVLAQHSHSSAPVPSACASGRPAGGTWEPRQHRRNDPDGPPLKGEGGHGRYAHDGDSLIDIFMLPSPQVQQEAHHRCSEKASSRERASRGEGALSEDPLPARPYRCLNAVGGGPATDAPRSGRYSPILGSRRTHTTRDPPLTHPAAAAGELTPGDPSLDHERGLLVGAPAADGHAAGRMLWHSAPDASGAAVSPPAHPPPLRASQSPSLVLSACLDVSPVSMSVSCSPETRRAFAGRKHGIVYSPSPDGALRRRGAHAPKAVRPHSVPLWSPGAVSRDSLENLVSSPSTGTPAVRGHRPSGYIASPGTLERDHFLTRRAPPAGVCPPPPTSVCGTHSGGPSVVTTHRPRDAASSSAGLTASITPTTSHGALDAACLRHSDARLPAAAGSAAAAAAGPATEGASPSASVSTDVSLSSHVSEELAPRRRGYASDASAAPPSVSTHARAPSRSGEMNAANGAAPPPGDWKVAASSSSARSTSKNEGDGAPPLVEVCLPDDVMVDPASFTAAGRVRASVRSASEELLGGGHASYDGSPTSTHEPNSLQSEPRSLLQSTTASTAVSQELLLGTTVSLADAQHTARADPSTHEGGHDRTVAQSEVEVLSVTSRVSDALLEVAGPVSEELLLSRRTASSSSPHAATAPRNAAPAASLPRSLLAGGLAAIWQELRTGGSGHSQDVDAPTATPCNTTCNTPRRNHAEVAVPVSVCTRGSEEVSIDCCDARRRSPSASPSSSARSPSLRGAKARSRSQHASPRDDAASCAAAPPPPPTVMSFTSDESFFSPASTQWERRSGRSPRQWGPGHDEPTPSRSPAHAHAALSGPPVSDNARASLPRLGHPAGHRSLADTVVSRASTVAGRPEDPISQGTTSTMSDYLSSAPGIARRRPRVPGATARGGSGSASSTRDLPAGVVVAGGVAVPAVPPSPFPQQPPVNASAGVGVADAGDEGGAQVAAAGSLPVPKLSGTHKRGSRDAAPRAHDIPEGCPTSEPADDVCARTLTPDDAVAYQVDSSAVTGAARLDEPAAAAGKAAPVVQPRVDKGVHTCRNRGRGAPLDPGDGSVQRGRVAPTVAAGAAAAATLSDTTQHPTRSPRTGAAGGVHNAEALPRVPQMMSSASSAQLGSVHALLEEVLGGSGGASETAAAIVDATNLHEHTRPDRTTRGPRAGRDFSALPAPHGVEQQKGKDTGKNITGLERDPYAGMDVSHHLEEAWCGGFTADVVDPPLGLPVVADREGMVRVGPSPSTAIMDGTQPGWGCPRRGAERGSDRDMNYNTFVNPQQHPSAALAAVHGAISAVPWKGDATPSQPVYSAPPAIGTLVVEHLHGGLSVAEQSVLHHPAAGDSSFSGATLLRRSGNSSVYPQHPDADIHKQRPPRSQRGAAELVPAPTRDVPEGTYYTDAATSPPVHPHPADASVATAYAATVGGAAATRVPERIRSDPLPKTPPSDPLVGRLVTTIMCRAPTAPSDATPDDVESSTGSDENDHMREGRDTLMALSSTIVNCRGMDEGRSAGGAAPGPSMVAVDEAVGEARVAPVPERGASVASYVGVPVVHDASWSLPSPLPPTPSTTGPPAYREVSPVAEVLLPLLAAPAKEDVEAASPSARWDMQQMCHGHRHALSARTGTPPGHPMRAAAVVPSMPPVDAPVPSRNPSPAESTLPSPEFDRSLSMASPRAVGPALATAAPPHHIPPPSEHTSPRPLLPAPQRFRSQRRGVAAAAAAVDAALRSPPRPQGRDSVVGTQAEGLLASAAAHGDEPPLQSPPRPLGTRPHSPERSRGRSVRGAGDDTNAADLSITDLTDTVAPPQSVATQTSRWEFAPGGFRPPPVSSRSGSGSCVSSARSGSGSASASAASTHAAPRAIPTSKILEGLDATGSPQPQPQPFNYTVYSEVPIDAFPPAHPHGLAAADALTVATLCDSFDDDVLLVQAARRVSQRRAAQSQSHSRSQPPHDGDADIALPCPADDTASGAVAPAPLPVHSPVRPAALASPPPRAGGVWGVVDPDASGVSAEYLSPAELSLASPARVVVPRPFPLADAAGAPQGPKVPAAAAARGPTTQEKKVKHPAPSDTATRTPRGRTGHRDGKKPLGVRRTPSAAAAAVRRGAEEKTMEGTNATPRAPGKTQGEKKGKVQQAQAQPQQPRKKVSTATEVQKPAPATPRSASKPPPQRQPQRGDTTAATGEVAPGVVLAASAAATPPQQPAPQGAVLRNYRSGGADAKGRARSASTASRATATPRQRQGASARVSSLSSAAGGGINDDFYNPFDSVGNVSSVFHAEPLLDGSESDGGGDEDASTLGWTLRDVGAAADSPGRTPSPQTPPRAPITSPSNNPYYLRGYKHALSAGNSSTRAGTPVGRRRAAGGGAVPPPLSLAGVAANPGAHKRMRVGTSPLSRHL